MNRVAPVDDKPQNRPLSNFNNGGCPTSNRITVASEKDSAGNIEGHVTNKEISYRPFEKLISRHCDRAQIPCGW